MKKLLLLSSLLISPLAFAEVPEQLSLSIEINKNGEDVHSINLTLLKYDKSRYTVDFRYRVAPDYGVGVVINDFLYEPTMVSAETKNSYGETISHASSLAYIKGDNEFNYESITDECGRFTAPIKIDDFSDHQLFDSTINGKNGCVFRLSLTNE
jgi:hypothetical protein